MSTILDIIPKTEDSSYDVEVNITEQALQCLDELDIEEQIGTGKRLVKFYVDGTLSLEECAEVLEKLESIAGNDGAISIFTSGRNFNDLMKAIKLRRSDIHHELHIDDNDIRSVLDVNNIICGLNFSRISCDCYFSDRYLVNFNPIDYINLSHFPECKFDRKRVDKMRSVIEEVWGELVPSVYYANALTSFAKTEMVLDYIEKNIANTTNAGEIRIDDVEDFSRRNYQVEDYADDAVGVFGEKDGTSTGKTRLAALLLDNYFAQVNCRVVNGKISGDSSVWLTTMNGGGEYGHSLDSNNLRFSNLEEFGYVDGVVSLEGDHKYRRDFSRPVDEYAELDEITYFNLKNSVEATRKTFIFSPKIIGTSVWDEDYSAEDIYRTVGTKGNGKFPGFNQMLSVKSAPRKIMDKVHVKKKFPEKFNKRNRHDIRK